MKKATRALALLLMLCMSIMAFAACGDDNNTSGGDASKGGSADTDNTSGPVDIFEGITDADYEGAEINILVPGDDYGTYKSVEIIRQENQPDVLNTEIAKRNELIESKFNVTITESRSDTGSNSMNSLIEQDVFGGNGEFDIVMPYINQAASLSLESYFKELHTLDNFNIDASCWDQNAVDAYSINGENYFVTGDISLLTLSCTHAIVFNKDMLATYGLGTPEDLYNTVKNGEWTIDKLQQMASAVTGDVDGQTGMSYKDRYGFLINSNFVTSMYLGTGAKLTAKDNEDIPYIAILEETETASSKFGKIFELVNDTKATGKIDYASSSYYTSAIADKGSVWTAATESVANDLALFRAMSIIDIIDLGEYDCNFGIVPIPKYDTQQDKYYSNVSIIYATGLAIPVSAPDPEMSAKIAQAMCQASTSTTKKAYFDVILKSRKIQDNESEEMLDIIFNSRVYDLGVAYAWGGNTSSTANSIGSFMDNIAMSGTNTFISTLDSIDDTIESALEETLNDFYAVEKK